MRKLFILISLAVLLFGCIEGQRLSIEDRLYCLNLTSKSHAFVPECDSSQKCFSEAEKNLFSFNDSGLNFLSRQALFRYKSSLSLSWLYFNKASLNLKKINSLCQQGTDYLGIQRETNELSNNLKEAFGFAEKANSESIAFLLIERSVLESEDINLVKEEPLFDSYSLIQSNLNQIENPDILKNDSFASSYRKAVSSFSSLSESKGFSGIIINELTYTDLLDSVDGDILKEAAKSRKGFHIPIISNMIGGTVSFINGFSRVDSAVSVIKNFPSAELLRLYSELAGFRDSVPEQFSGLAKSAAESRELIESNANSVKVQLNEKISSVSEKLAEIHGNLPFDSGTVSFIASVSNSVFPNPLTLKQDSEKELLETRLQLQELEQLERRSELSKGKMLSMLRILLSRARLLEEKIDFFNENFYSGIKASCFGTVSLIESKISSIIPSGESEAAAMEKTLFYAKKFASSVSFIDSAENCMKAVSSFQELNEMLKLHGKDASEITASSDKCIQQSESLASAANDEYFNSLLEQLKKNKSLYGGEEFLAQCISLKSALEKQLSNQADFSLLEKDHFYAKTLYSELQLLSKYSERNESFAELNEGISYADEFFENEKISVEKALPLIEKLSKTVAKNKSLAEKYFGEGLSDYFSKNHSIESFSAELPAAGKKFTAISRISFNNFFQDLNKEIIVKIAAPAGIVSSKSSNIPGADFSGNGLFIHFDSVPEGISFIELQSESIISAEVKETLISSGNGLDTFKSEITFHSTQAFPKALAELEARNGIIPSSLKAFDSFNLIDSWIDFGKIKIIAENVFEGKKVNAYYSVKSPDYNESIPEKNDPAFYSQFLIQLKSDISSAEEKLSSAISLGLKDYADSLRKKISDAKLALMNAEQLAFSGRFDEASSLLFKAKSMLYSVDDSAFTESLFKKIDSIVSDEGDFFRLVYSFELNDSEIAGKRQEFLKASADAKSGKIPASESVSLLESMLSEIKNSAGEKASQKAFFLKQSFASKEDSAFGLLRLLESELESVSAKELIDAKYVAPFAEKDLEKIRSELESLSGKRFDEKFAEFSSEADFNGIKALLLFNDFKKEFYEKQSALDSINSRLEGLYERLKIDAAARIKSFPEIPETAGLSLEKKKYLKAIVAAAAFSPAVKTESIGEIIYYLFPLGIAFAAFFALRLRNNKKQLPEFKAIEKA